MSALTGLRVRLQPCRKCQCVTAHISEDVLLVCECCGANRGDLDLETQKFLRDFVAIFGPPTALIEIREPSLLPSGAGAETEIIAPTED
jgi:hypothetical protein